MLLYHIVMHKFSLLSESIINKAWKYFKSLYFEAIFKNTLFAVIPLFFKKLKNEAVKV